MGTNNPQKNIPDGWKEIKLGEVLTVGSGKDYKHLEKGDIPVFGTGGFMAYVDKPLYSGETVFIGRKGTIDKPFYFKGDFWTVDTLFYTYNYKNTIAKYINFVFQKINWKLYNEASGVPSLSKNTIEKIKFIFPSLPEQKRIVAVFESWDQMINKLAKKIKIKKNVKKGLMQNLLTGKVRLAGFNDEWQSIKLSDVCKRIRTGKLDANAMVSGGKYRFYTCAKNYYRINEYAFDTEALLVSGNGANVGYIHYYKGKFNAYQRTYVLDNFVSDIIFTKYVLDEYLHKRIFEEKCDGNTPYIKMDTLTDMKIKIPKTKEEQKNIADVIAIADEEIKALEKKLTIFKNQKKYLLNNLITGTIRTKS